MNLIVQKYGGSSVASLNHLRRVAQRIAKTRAQGHDVMVVVSAMGKMTSDLLGRAQALASEPQPRELDMLLSADERISMSLPSQWLEAPDALSCLLPEASMDNAARLLHEEFIQPSRNKAAA